jgi:hypothetical protein
VFKISEKNKIGRERREILPEKVLFELRTEKLLSGNSGRKTIAVR